MNKTYSAICYIISGIIILILAFTLTSCGSLRHYKKVAKDAPRNEAKRNLLAPICALEFPVKNKVDSIVVTEYKADTANELKLKLIIKQLLRQLQQRPECPQIDEDSLYNAIKSNIKTDTLRIKEKVTIKTIDSAYIYQLTSAFEKNYNTLQRSYYDSLSELRQVKKELQELKDNTHKNKWLVWQLIKINWWWLLAILVVIGGYFYIKNNNAVLKNILNKLK